MSNQSTRQTSLQITSSVAAVTLTDTLQSGSGIPDIKKLVLANSSATGTLVTLSDGKHNWYFWLPATSNIICDYLPASVNGTKWTATCNTSVASVYVSVLF